jgi:hypothetical protein
MDYFKKASVKKVTLDDGSEHHIRKLSQAAVETIQKQYSTADKIVTGLKYIVTQSIVNENGERVFKDSQMDSMSEVDFDILNQLGLAIMEYSGLQTQKKD